MIELAAPAAYRAWAAGYDDTVNPLLALEMRVLAQRLGPLDGRRVLDVAAGTGRWTVYAGAHGASVIGLDLSPDMLAVAARKCVPGGRLAVADMRALPIADSAADMALCSFALGYVKSIDGAIEEMARVARCVIVSDLHPAAVEAGWSRSFRSGADVYSIRSYCHSFAAMDRAARAAGLEKLWDVESHFGEPERRFFQAAGREARFEAAAGVPAIYARCWGRT